jgi:hypothetical protein
MNRSRRSIVPRLMSLAFLTLLLLYASPSGAQQATQSARPVYVVLDYMKVAPGKEDEYLRLEREIWKPVHQERIRNKRMVAWELYAVPYTAETQRQYEFVTVNVYDSFAAIGGDSTFEQLFRRVHAGKDAARLLAQTVEARQVARSEVWRQLDQTAPRNAASAPQSRYLLVDFMRSKPGVDYVAVERDLWKPVHQDRVRSRALNQWSLYELVVPGGTSYPYDYAAVNAVGSLSALEAPYPEELFRRVHPRTPLTQIANRTGASRDLVRRELWVLVDATP